MAVQQKLSRRVSAARDKILSKLTLNSGAMPLAQLKKQLVGDDKSMTEQAFDSALAEITKAKKAVTQKDGTVMLKKRAEAHVYRGVVQGHRDGYGFLICDEDVPDLFITEEEMTKVLPGDVVEAISLSSDARGRQIAEIQKLIKRRMTKIVGRLTLGRNKLGRIISAVVTAEDIRITHRFTLEPNTVSKEMDGKIVVVEPNETGLFEDDAKWSAIKSKLVEVLGDIEDPGMEIEIAVRKFNLPHQFSEANKAEIAKFSDHVTKADLRNRVDLRDIPFVTIDGADARDFDDAVFCLPVERKKGWYRLLVAIADVSHYVKPGSAIDKDAQLRTTSVYFPRRVIPMLPEELSNGLCSLNPHVDRCTMVCDSVISPEGEVTAYQFYPAVIRSAARLIYDDVWAALQDPNGPAAAAMDHVLGNVQDLYDLFKILLKSRTLRGAMDFETVETYIVANEQGKIEKILPRERNDAHRLIEEMMLVANTCAADFLLKNKAPCLFRIHEPPSEDRLEKARAALAQFNVRLGGGSIPSPSDYCEALDQIRDRPDKAAIQMILLRSMQQAVYSPHNVGHFGLAYEAYTHFTSPIRRYPDLLVHRAIRGVLRGRKYVPKILVSPDEVDVPIQTRELIVKEGEDKPKVPHIEVWEKLGLLCSANERRADEASYDVMGWLKTYYMEQHIGEVYKGIISGVSPFGIYVTLDDLYVDGAIHVSNLGREYFEYSESANALIGQDSGQRYSVGTPVVVKVVRCDLDARRIEFSIEEAVRGRRVKKQRAAGRETFGRAAGKRKSK